MYLAYLINLRGKKREKKREKERKKKKRKKKKEKKRKRGEGGGEKRKGRRRKERRSIHSLGDVGRFSAGRHVPPPAGCSNNVGGSSLTALRGC